MNAQQNKTLTAATLLFMLVVLFVMVIQWIASPQYKVANNTIAVMANDPGRHVLPHTLHEIALHDRLNEYVLVDLREEELFFQGSLPGAVNIPFGRLLEKSLMKQFKDKRPVLLFSDEESLSSFACMMLTSLGLSNIHYLANDYTFIKEHVLDHYFSADAFRQDEKARFDYNRFFNASRQSNGEAIKQQPKILEVEVISAQGGC